MTILCQLPEKSTLPIIQHMGTFDIDVLIGRNLRRVREKKKLSQAKLAEMIGTTPQRLSAYETGRDGMGKDYMERVCRALKIEPWEFYISETTPIVLDDYEIKILKMFRGESSGSFKEEILRYGKFVIDQANKKIDKQQRAAKKKKKAELERMQSDNKKAKDNEEIVPN